jgi:hypothetical protein
LAGSAARREKGRRGKGGKGREGKERRGKRRADGRDRKVVFLLIYNWARRSLSLPVVGTFNALCRGGIPCTRVPS